MNQIAQEKKIFKQIQRNQTFSINKEKIQQSQNLQNNKNNVKNDFLEQINSKNNDQDKSQKSSKSFEDFKGDSQNNYNFNSQSNFSNHNNTVSILSKIISSNEDMLKQQTNQLKIYRCMLNEKQQSFQTAQKKYNILIQSIEKNKENPAQILLDRIVEIQKELIQAKIQLAIKSPQQYQQQLNEQKSKYLKLSKTLSSHTKTYSDASSEHQQQKQSFIYSNIVTKNNINQQFQINGVMYKDIFEQNRRKLSQQEQNHLMLWKKQLEQFSDNIFSMSVSNIDLSDLNKFKEKSSLLLKKHISIPHQLRLKIWPILIKNILGISNSLYIELLDHQKKGWISQKVKSQIQKDMIRSFNGRGTMQNLQKVKLIDQQKNSYTTINTNRIAQDATQILEIFHIYRPDIGYVQGMTYPTIILTLVVGKITAFIILSNLLIGNQFFRKLITFQPNFISIFCRTFDKIVESFFPSISKHLKKLQIHSQVYLVDWFFTFFSRGLSPKTILCIWDNIFYYQQLAMYRLSLAIFQLLQQNIIQNQYQNCIRLIRQYYLNIDQKQLLQVFNNSSLTKEKYQKTFKSIRKNF